MNPAAPMNPGVDTRDPLIDRWQRLALMVGVLALVLCAVGAFLDSGQFFRSYLLGYLFWVGLALGSLGITMLHNVVGGRWGALIRRFLMAGRSTLPLMAVLVIPILVGIPSLYHWAHHDAALHDEVLQHKAPYLNVPFFVIRTVIYFVVWLGLMLLLTRRRADEVDPIEQARVKAISAPGLIIFAFTCTFAAVDWIMSLEPHWFSTMYGAIFLVGQALLTFAFCIALLVLFSGREPFRSLLRGEHYHDLGNLMFAFTVLWAYTSFSQFLIIWSGNIPEETPWYIRRSNNGWQFVAVLLSGFHFVLPFFILLNRYVKQRGRWLARVALWIIAARLLDLFYWVAPSHADSFHLHPLDLLAPLGIGGIWLAFFFFQLKKGPLLNIHDPRLIAKGGHH